MTFAHILKKDDPEAGNLVAHESQCHTCAWRKLGTVNCDAFPKGIPLEILMGAWDHTAEWPGDQGIRYVHMDEVK